MTYEELKAAYEAAVQKCSELEKENDELKKSNEDQALHIEHLEEQILKRNKMLFGQKSEKSKFICNGQMDLDGNVFNEAEELTNLSAAEPTEDSITKKSKKTGKHRGRNELRGDLETKEIVHTLPEDQRKCAVCGSKLVPFSKEYITTRLCIIPAKIFKITYFREVYKCEHCDKHGDKANIVKAPNLTPAPVIPKGLPEQRMLLRALMNVRAPKPIDEIFLQVQNEYLQEVIEEKGVTDLDDLTPVKDNLYVWQGDITTLRCDAIVNAANSQMTGCYIPGHACIDNCIHTYAGVQLRYDCFQKIQKQGFEEPTGQAKITPAYNLPCRYVLHTVGPIINGHLTKKDHDLLANCYTSCLQLATDYHLESVAFCCISTGVFHFPNEKAAEIAIASTTDFLKQNDTTVKKVVFNVFKENDKEIYERLLGSN